VDSRSFPILPQSVTTAKDGHDARTGRFTRGNRAASGNRTAKKAASFRRELFRVVKVADVAAIVQKVVDQAKAGEPWAVRLLFDRLLGPCLPIDVETRLRALEDVLLRGNRHGHL